MRVALLGHSSVRVNGFRAKNVNLPNNILAQHVPFACPVFLVLCRALFARSCFSQDTQHVTESPFVLCGALSLHLERYIMQLHPLSPRPLFWTN